MLETLQALVKEQNLDAYLLPMADQFQNEYVPAHAARIQTMCGFTGSAGTLVVLPDRAVLFTDGRYSIQAAQEVPNNVEVVNIRDASPAAWLEKELGSNAHIGADAWQYTIQQWQQLEQRFCHLTTTENLADQAWKNKPEAPSAPVFLHDEIYAGKSYTEKWQALAAHFPLLITESASLCWLLNIRGDDTPCTPLLNGFAILENENITVCCDVEKIPDSVKKARPEVVFLHMEEISNVVHIAKLHYDPTGCPAALKAHLAADAIAAPNPILLQKACKNSTEQAGMIACHKRDGAALQEVLNWIAAQTAGSFTELDVVAQLNNARAKQELFHDISFPPIVGYGSNGAIVHYHATENTNKTIEAGSLLLMDSGGQYLDGTTDVTRTIAIGTPTRQMQEDYTRVLKGHIALALAVFPRGTTGTQLDVLARQYLWQAGDNFDHGTGHGVGHFLSVHEGPQGISTRPNHVALQEGMILSNEPGIYREGEYGIRIENLVMVQAHPEYDGFLHFITLTHAPYDDTLIIESWLNEAEQEYLDNYKI